MTSEYFTIVTYYNTTGPFSFYYTHISYRSQNCISINQNIKINFLILMLGGFHNKINRSTNNSQPLSENQLQHHDS